MKELESWEKELREELLPEQELTAEETRAAEKEFEKKISRAIDRRIRTICLKTLAVVAACCLLLLGISPVMSALFPSPGHVVRGQDIDIYTYLDAYYETTRPYVELAIPSRDTGFGRDNYLVRPKGFGCYEIDIDLADPRKDGWVHVGDVDAAATLRFGKFALIPGNAGNELDSLCTWFSGHGNTPEEVRELIADYPKASGGYFNVTLSAPVEISSLRNEKGNVLWAEVYNNETGDFRGGLRLYDRTNNGELPWRQKLSDEELKERFLKNLDTVLAAPKLLGQLGLTIEIQEMEDVENYAGGGWDIQGDAAPYFEAVRDAVSRQEGPLMTERIAVGGTQEELLAFLERGDIEKVSIESYYLEKLV